jgi:hypothetical protein
MSDFSNKIKIQINSMIQKIKNDTIPYINTLNKSEIAEDYNEFNPKKHKVLKTHAVFSKRPEIKDLGVLEIMAGGADFQDSNVKNLGNLRIIGGTTKLDSKINDLGKLEAIIGKLSLGDSEVEDLKNLQIIGSDLHIDHNANLKSLGKLKYIGGSLTLDSDKAELEEIKLESLGDLKIVEGDVVLTGSRVKSLNRLLTIGGSINFTGSVVKDLGQLTNVGFDLFNTVFDNFEIEDYVTCNDSKYYSKNFPLDSSVNCQDVINHLKKMRGGYNGIKNLLTYVGSKLLSKNYDGFSADNAAFYMPSQVIGKTNELELLIENTGIMLDERGIIKIIKTF